MAKWIVDGPEPQKGQVASSGGIRNKKGGQIVTQYSNPQPYKEPEIKQQSKGNGNAFMQYVANLEIAKARRNGPKKQLFSAEFDFLEVMGKEIGRLLVSDIYKKTLNNQYTEKEFLGGGLDGSRRDSYEARFNIDGKFISIKFSPSEDLVNAIKRQYPDKVVSEEK